MSMREAAQAFQMALPFFKVFNPYAQHLANFRDHALLAYKHLGANPQPDPRRFPTIHYL